MIRPMSTPKKPINLDVFQGKTFSRTLRWGDSEKIAKAITGVTKAFPAVVTATGHGLPDGWPAWIASVQGMTELNRVKQYRTKNVDANSVKLVNLNSTDFTTYTAGGLLIYNTPKSLAGLTARMHIRPDWKSTSLHLALTNTPNVNGSAIVLDDTAKTIVIQIGALDAAALDFDNNPKPGLAVYDLELVSAAPVVSCPAWGYITLKKESTT